VAALVQRTVAPALPPSARLVVRTVLDLARSENGMFSAEDVLLFLGVTVRVRRRRAFQGARKREGRAPLPPPGGRESPWLRARLLRLPEGAWASDADADADADARSSIGTGSRLGLGGRQNPVQNRRTPQGQNDRLEWVGGSPAAAVRVFREQAIERSHARSTKCDASDTDRDRDTRMRPMPSVSSSNGSARTYTSDVLRAEISSIHDCASGELQSGVAPDRPKDARKSPTSGNRGSGTEEAHTLPLVFDPMGGLPWEDLAELRHWLALAGASYEADEASVRAVLRKTTRPPTAPFSAGKSSSSRGEQSQRRFGDPVETDPSLSTDTSSTRTREKVSADAVAGAGAPYGLGVDRELGAAHRELPDDAAAS